MNTKENHDQNGIDRYVQTFENGVRRVVLRYRGESWSSYMIIPRQILVQGIRRRRAAGAHYHDCDWWTLVPGIDRWIASEGYGGPGQAFAREPYRMASSRRFVVIVQTGGLDV